MAIRKHLLSALVSHWRSEKLAATGVTLQLPIDGISLPEELRSVVGEAERLLYFENVTEGVGPHGLVFEVDLTVRGQEVFGVEP